MLQKYLCGCVGWCRLLRQTSSSCRNPYKNTTAHHSPFINHIAAPLDSLVELVTIG